MWQSLVCAIAKAHSLLWFVGISPMCSMELCLKGEKKDPQREKYCSDQDKDWGRRRNRLKEGWREEELSLQRKTVGIPFIRSSSHCCSCLYGSKEKVKLCEGGGETSGEKRKASASATGAPGKESSGTNHIRSFLNNTIYLLNLE